MDNHRIDINGIDSEERFNAFFEDGVYRELVRLPNKKHGLMQSLPDENGTRVDTASNFYESKNMALPMAICADNEEQLLLKYMAFSKFIRTGVPIVLSVHFFGIKYTLRYDSVTNVVWNETVVTFNLNVFDDNPTADTPI